MGKGSLRAVKLHEAGLQTGRVSKGPAVICNTATCHLLNFNLRKLLGFPRRCSARGCNKLVYVGPGASRSFIFERKARVLA